MPGGLPGALGQGALTQLLLPLPLLLPPLLGAGSAMLGAPLQLLPLALEAGLRPGQGGWAVGKLLATAAGGGALNALARPWAPQTVGPEAWVGGRMSVALGDSGC